MKHNDLNIEDWKELDINTDSLWLIKERDKSGKHKNIYHGNFIPQIPNQLIRRYTKKDEIVFEPFMGSGTTLFECEKLNRKYVGLDINPEMVEYVQEMMQGESENTDYFINECNSVSKQQIDNNLTLAFQRFSKDNVQFVLMHPPYLDIVKFTDNPNDLSQINNLKEFIAKFRIVCENSLKYLVKNRYFAIVVGDVYKNSEVNPLAFYCMDMIKRHFKVKLKGIIVNNIRAVVTTNNKGVIQKISAMSIQKDLTYSEAIEQVMLNNGNFAPLKLLYEQIWNYKDKSKIVGITPDKTIQERVQRDDRFTRIAKGVYALTDFIEDVEKEDLGFFSVERNEIVFRKTKEFVNTEKVVEQKVRIGQSYFRKRLLAEMKRCPITGIDEKRPLIASHIKPWVHSNNEERVNIKNGLLFSPLFDKLFDKNVGLITFTLEKEILISKKLSKDNRKRLNIFDKQKIENLDINGREEFLEYHREFIFQG